MTLRPSLPCAGQDALRESFPDMPREDRQLLMLRFVREVDQSVDYREVGLIFARSDWRTWALCDVFSLTQKKTEDLGKNAGGKEAGVVDALDSDSLVYGAFLRPHRTP